MIAAALAAVEGWNVPAARAAVVLDDGAVITHGDPLLVGRWASVTKLVSAVAVLRAVDSRRIDLDEEAGPPGSTVRHLLAHASGLPFGGVGRFDRLDWGLGFEIRGHKAPHWTGTRNSPATYGHFGGSGGFLWVDPEAAIAMALLTDREYGPWALDVWPLLSDAVLAASAPSSGQ